MCSYTEQLDVHEPYLTVRETFMFAGACQVPVVDEKLLATAYGKVLVETLDLPEGLKADVLAGRNLTDLRVSQPTGRKARIPFTHIKHTHTHTLNTHIKHTH